MNVLARFHAIKENDKAAVVRKLMETSTPDFDFFYLVALATLMATFGMLDNNATIVIGSMLLAPIMYPILAFALGLVMSNGVVLGRSVITLTKSFGISLGLSILAAFLLGTPGEALPQEVLLRTQPDLLHFLVAFVAGLAVSFALAQPEWSETIPGIAISVALIPPLAAIGVGVAAIDMSVVAGAVVLLAVNLLGIIFAAMISFSLMNLYQKQNIATSTIRREEERLEEEQRSIEETEREMKKRANGN